MAQRLGNFGCHHRHSRLAISIVGGGKLVRQAFRALLTKSTRKPSPPSLPVNEERGDDWIDIHSLRAASGDDVFIDCHLVVPNERTVRELGEVDELEHKVLARLDAHGAFLIHFDFPGEGLSDEALAEIYPTYGKPFTVEACTRLTVDEMISSTRHKSSYTRSNLAICCPLFWSSVCSPESRQLYAQEVGKKWIADKTGLWGIPSTGR